MDALMDHDRRLAASSPFAALFPSHSGRATCWSTSSRFSRVKMVAAFLSSGGAERRPQPATRRDAASTGGVHGWLLVSKVSDFQIQHGRPLSRCAAGMDSHADHDVLCGAGCPEQKLGQAG